MRFYENAPLFYVNCDDLELDTTITSLWFSEVAYYHEEKSIEISDINIKTKSENPYITKDKNTKIKEVFDLVKMKYDSNTLAKNFVEKYVSPKIPEQFTGRVCSSKSSQGGGEDCVCFIFEEGVVREIYDYCYDSMGTHWLNFKLLITPCSFLYQYIDPRYPRCFLPHM